MKYAPSETTVSRFKELKRHVFRQLGDRLYLSFDGRVIVAANEFSGERFFHSLQSAADHYARFLPTDF